VYHGLYGKYLAPKSFVPAASLRYSIDINANSKNPGSEERNSKNAAGEERNSKNAAGEERNNTSNEKDNNGNSASTGKSNNGEKIAISDINGNGTNGNANTKSNTLSANGNGKRADIEGNLNETTKNGNAKGNRGTDNGNGNGNANNGDANGNTNNGNTKDGNANLNTINPSANRNTNNGNAKGNTNNSNTQGNVNNGNANNGNFSSGNTNSSHANGNTNDGSNNARADMRSDMNRKPNNGETSERNKMGVRSLENRVRSLEDSDKGEAERRVAASTSELAPTSTKNTLLNPHYQRFGAGSTSDPASSENRNEERVFLEIGLGCNMDYGPGASAKIWVNMFRNTRQESTVPPKENISAPENNKVGPSGAMMETSASASTAGASTAAASDSASVGGVSGSTGNSGVNKNDSSKNVTNGIKSEGKTEISKPPTAGRMMTRDPTSTTGEINEKISRDSWQVHFVEFDKNCIERHVARSNSGRNKKLAENLYQIASDSSVSSSPNRQRSSSGRSNLPENSPMNYPKRMSPQTTDLSPSASSLHGASQTAEKTPESHYTVHLGDQADSKFLEALKLGLGPNSVADIVIDDGGHANHQILKSFFALWPIVRPGGFYFVEDLAGRG